MLVEFTNPGTEQQMSIESSNVLLVVMALPAMYAQGARTIIQTNVVQADQQTGKPVTISVVAAEPYSEVMRRLKPDYEPSARQLELEREAEDARARAQIAIPDSAAIRNLARKGD